MKRLAAYIFILFTLGFLVFSSCKKKNELNPYPTNERVMNILKKTTVGTVVTTENFRFSYDVFNRVKKVIYTTTNPLQTNVVREFIYSNDTIYRKTSLVNDQVIQIDTFITDRRGHINATYILNDRTGYSYYNDLLTRIDYDPYNYVLLTSFNGNITQILPNGSFFASGEYTYYTDKANRPGDYLYLTTICDYGLNFYNNKNLVDSFNLRYSYGRASYEIEADRKITRTTVGIRDTGLLGGYRTEVYDLQYEKY